MLTTHSPYLLDHLGKDEVQIVTRDASGASDITPMAEFPDIENWQKGFTLGEIWTNLGEEVLVKRGQAQLSPRGRRTPRHRESLRRDRFHRGVD